MKDREFLIWIHKRLEHKYHEDPLFDFMHKLRAIIAVTPPDKETPNIANTYSVDSLLQKEH